ncbi:MAG: hypothetical protein KBF88_15650 [Polyangiaceae bacterium]|nr:hypothetical protein [Polyangiaceae bacterium]
MKIISVLAVSALVIGCGSSDEPATSGGTMNEQAAKQNVAQSTMGISTAVDKDQGEAGATLLMQAAQAGQGTVSPSEGAALGAMDGIRLQAGPGCECAGQSCTFTNCSPSNGVTINGKFSWAGGKVTCTDYTWDISGAQAGGFTYKIVLNCDLTVVAGTSIDGFISSAGEATIANLPAGVPGGSGNVSFKTKTVFKAVGYGPSGPTSGSVEFTSSTSAGGKEYGAQKTFTYPQ